MAVHRSAAVWVSDVLYGTVAFRISILLTVIEVTEPPAPAVSATEPVDCTSRVSEPDASENVHSSVPVGAASAVAGWLPV